MKRLSTFTLTIERLQLTLFLFFMYDNNYTFLLFADMYNLIKMQLKEKAGELKTIILDHQKLIK